MSFSTRFLALSAAFAMAAGGPLLADALEVGDEAPDFTLAATDGSEVTLSAQIGEKNVVLAFFPKAFTGG
jgi:peroxiredoxin Q/BCP